MTIEHDPEVNAAYIYVNDLPVARTRMVDDNHLVDYAADGQIVGVEFLDGVNIERLPDDVKAAVRRAILADLTRSGQATGHYFD